MDFRKKNKKRWIGESTGLEPPTSGLRDEHAACWTNQSTLMWEPSDQIYNHPVIY